MVNKTNILRPELAKIDPQLSFRFKNKRASLLRLALVFVASAGIEPAYEAPETSILSIELRRHFGERKYSHFLFFLVK